MSTKIGACCGLPFQPDPRVKNHAFCSVPDCPRQPLPHCQRHCCAASLPIHIFQDRAERERKQIPHLMLEGNLRFSLQAVLDREMANSILFLNFRDRHDEVDALMCNDHCLLIGPFEVISLLRALLW